MNRFYWVCLALFMAAFVIASSACAGGDDESGAPEDGAREGDGAREYVG